MSLPQPSTIIVPELTLLPVGPIEAVETQTWEEPHPGRRLSYHGPGSGERAVGAGLLQTNEGGRGGMAAKREIPYRQHGKLVRKNIKIRTRVPKPITISTKVTGELGVKSAPIPETQSMLSSPASTRMLLSAAIRTEEHVPDPIDTETETEVEGEADAQMSCDETDIDGASTPTLTGPPVPFALTDFSNLLGITLDAGDDRDSVTVVDPDAFCHAGASEDMYGWEAELERKLQPGTPCTCDHTLEYRRGWIGGKRGLLHRVFSLGQAPRELSTDVSRASMGM